MNGKLITLEGVSGIGKSFYFNKLESLSNNDNLIFNKEITDGIHSGINEKLFEILLSSNSPFFDMGNPKLETLLIASKQANDEETFIIPALTSGKSVISDRGYDTICVLQGLLFSLKYGKDPLYYSKKIYEALSLFNILPDKVVLLTGDVELAIKRAELRNDKPYTEEEKHFLRLCSKLFIDFSRIYQDRYEIVNVDEGTKSTVSQLKRIIKKEGIEL